MKKKLQKLTLNRETLLHLETNKLSNVAGAVTLAPRCSGTCSEDSACGSGTISDYISGCHDCPSWDICGGPTGTCV